MKFPTHNFTIISAYLIIPVICPDIVPFGGCIYCNRKTYEIFENGVMETLNTIETKMAKPFSDDQIKQVKEYIAEIRRLVKHDTNPGSKTIYDWMEYVKDEKAPEEISKLKVQVENLIDNIRKIIGGSYGAVQYQWSIKGDVRQMLINVLQINAAQEQAIAANKIVEPQHTEKVIHVCFNGCYQSNNQPNENGELAVDPMFIQFGQFRLNSPTSQQRVSIDIGDVKKECVGLEQKRQKEDVMITLFNSANKKNKLLPIVKTAHKFKSTVESFCWRLLLIEQSKIPKEHVALNKEFNGEKHIGSMYDSPESFFGNYRKKRGPHGENATEVLKQLCVIKSS